jgi:hypothetical protein
MEMSPVVRLIVPVPDIPVGATAILQLIGPLTIPFKLVPETVALLS